MNARNIALILIAGGVCLTAMAQQPTPHPMGPREAEDYLGSLIGAGHKNEELRPLVLTSEIKITNVRTTCSSSGTVDGSVDDNGNFSGRTNSSSDCHKTATRHHKLFLALPLPEQNNYAVLIAHCAEAWVWNHCDDPPANTYYPVIIEKEKHGFNLFAATAQKVGGKLRVARYEILQVDRVVLPDKVPQPPGDKRE